MFPGRLSMHQSTKVTFTVSELHVKVLSDSWVPSTGWGAAMRALSMADFHWLKSAVDGWL